MTQFSAMFELLAVNSTFNIYTKIQFQNQV